MRCGWVVWPMLLLTAVYRGMCALVTGKVMVYIWRRKKYRGMCRDALNPRRSKWASLGEEFLLAWLPRSALSQGGTP